MAALDREVAEEKAETAEAEVHKLTERVEELELELAVLKEENGELLQAKIHLSKLTPEVAEYERPVSGLAEGKTSFAYLQLEKQNERLKEALMR